MNKVAIVCLARYPEIFEPCRESLARFAPDVPKILVRDGTDISDPEGWVQVQGEEPFIMAKNVNRGFDIACGWDVLFVTDDVRFIAPGTVEELQRLAYLDPQIGILSPLIRGGCDNILQREGGTVYLSDIGVAFSEQRLVFICPYIKREVIDKIGGLDERFIGYGWDDDDYSRRTQLAGYKLGVARHVVVQHADGASNTLSYTRRNTAAGVSQMCESNRQLFEQKWGR
jgi:hypothetical protein